MDESTPRSPNHDRPYRIIGAIVVLLGLTFCYGFLVRPWLDPSATFNVKWAMTGPALVVLGLLHVVKGAWADEILRAEDTKSLRATATLAAVLVLIAIGVWWLRS